MTGGPPVAGFEAAERAALVAASALVLAAALAGGVLAFAEPAALSPVAVQVPTHLLLGRETGIPAGLAAGGPAWAVAAVAFWQDALVLLVGYPLACAAARGALRLPFAKRWSRPEAAGFRARAGRTEAVGVALLAGSLWVPFLPSGALVAALAGRALGYRAGVLLPALVASTLLATVAYTALIATVLASAEDPRVTWGLVASGGVLALVVGLVVRVRSRRAGRPVA